MSILPVHLFLPLLQREPQCPVVTLRKRTEAKGWPPQCGHARGKFFGIAGVRAANE